MTVSTEISSNEYTGNGVTTDFDYKFRIFKASDLNVTTSDADGDNVVTLRLGTDYTVTGANKSAGGKVILTKPLANGHKISIVRVIPIVQETSFRNQGKFLAETHEDAFDYLTMLMQRLWGNLGLFLKRPSILANWFDAKGYRIANLGKPKRDSDAVDLGTLKYEIEGVNSTILKNEKRLLRVDDMDISALPKANDRAGNVLTFDKDGKPIVIAPVSGSAVDVLNKLGSEGGSNYVNGSKAWIQSINNVVTQKLEIGSVLIGGNYTWKNERLYKIIGYDGIVSSIEGRVITLDGGKKSYLVDAAFHEGNVEAWGVSSDNSYILNYELFQSCIYHASGVGVDGIVTTSENLLNVKPRHCVYAFIDFKTKPVNILHTTKIYGLRGVGGQLLNDGIEFIIDEPSKGCFIFDPKNYCTDHVNTHYYGGAIKYLSSSVSGSESILSFVYADYSCAIDVEGNRAYGMEFMFWQHDGWAARVSNNISNTSVGAFYLNRITTGLADNNYCNYGSSGTGTIGFDYILSGEIEVSSPDVFTKAKYKYSRAVHSVSSNMDFIANTFEHWDIVRAMFSGSVGISSDYIENIKICIYATTKVSCIFKPLTIFLGSQANCVLMQNNNTSANAADSIIIDLTSLTSNTSRVYGIGSPIYRGSDSKVIFNNLFLIQSDINRLGKYSQPHAKIQVDSVVNIYCSNTGSSTASGLSPNNAVLTIMDALNIAEMIENSDVIINIMNDVNFTYQGLDQVFSSRRSGVKIVGNGHSIVWGNDADAIPAIETDDIKFENVNIIVPKTIVTRSRRNILRPISSANYIFIECNLTLNDSFILGDYNDKCTIVTLYLTKTNQLSESGGIIRAVPSNRERIILTYIKNKCNIIGSEGGGNVIKIAEVTL